MSPAQSATTFESAKVHPTSEAGFGEGKAELYDEVRPSYPPEALSKIRKLVAGKDELNVVEIGCGSGKFTRVLLSHPEWRQSIKELRCVEPSAGMRDVFSKTVVDPRVSISDGFFEATGVPDHWADVIVMASAFHWCQDLEAATAEFVRILKPDGVVGLIWNTSYHEKIGWTQQTHEFCLQFQENTPSKPEKVYKWMHTFFDLPLYRDNFSEPENEDIPFIEHRSLDSTLTFFLTWSGVAIQPDEVKENIRERIKAILDQGEGLVWVDERKKILEFPFTTKLVTFRRIPNGGN